MSSQPKPHLKRVKCIIYWNPEEIEGHTAVPGWQVLPYRAAGDDNFCGLGVTIQEAWEDYLSTLKYNPL